jgi:hypothetical protein
MLNVYVKRSPEFIETERRESLERDARRAGLDLNASSEQMFRVSPECLDDDQRRILRGMFEQAYQKKHKHFCELCKSPIRCDVKDCTETGGYDHCDDDDNQFSRPNRINVVWL